MKTRLMGFWYRQRRVLALVLFGLVVVAGVGTAVMVRADSGGGAGGGESTCTSGCEMVPKIKWSFGGWHTPESAFADIARENKLEKPSMDEITGFGAASKAAYDKAVAQCKDSDSACKHPVIVSVGYVLSYKHDVDNNPVGDPQGFAGSIKYGDTSLSAVKKLWGEAYGADGFDTCNAARSLGKQMNTCVVFSSSSSAKAFSLNQRAGQDSNYGSSTIVVMVVLSGGQHDNMVEACEKFTAGTYGGSTDLGDARGRGIVKSTTSGDWFIGDKSVDVPVSMAVADNRVLPSNGWFTDSNGVLYKYVDTLDVARSIKLVDGTGSTKFAANKDFYSGNFLVAEDKTLWKLDGTTATKMADGAKFSKASYDYFLSSSTGRDSYGRSRLAADDTGKLWRIASWCNIESSSCQEGPVTKLPIDSTFEPGFSAGIFDHYVTDSTGTLWWIDGDTAEDLGRDHTWGKNLSVSGTNGVLNDYSSETDGNVAFLSDDDGKLWAVGHRDGLVYCNGDGNDPVDCGKADTDSSWLTRAVPASIKMQPGLLTSVSSYKGTGGTSGQAFFLSSENKVFYIGLGIDVLNRDPFSDVVSFPVSGLEARAAGKLMGEGTLDFTDKSGHRWHYDAGTDRAKTNAGLIDSGESTFTNIPDFSGVPVAVGLTDDQGNYWGAPGFSPKLKQDAGGKKFASDLLDVYGDYLSTTDGSAIYMWNGLKDDPKLSLVASSTGFKSGVLTKSSRWTDGAGNAWYIDAGNDSGRVWKNSSTKVDTGTSRFAPSTVFDGDTAVDTDGNLWDLTDDDENVFNDYARGTEYLSECPVTFTFDANGGKWSGDLGGATKVAYVLKKGSLQTDPSTGKINKWNESNVVWDSYHLRVDGWFTSKEGQTKFDFNTPINKDTIVYAKWRYRVVVSWKKSLPDSSLSNEELIKVTKWDVVKPDGTKLTLSSCPSTPSTGDLGNSLCTEEDNQLYGGGRVRQFAFMTLDTASDAGIYTITESQAPAVVYEANEFGDKRSVYYQKSNATYQLKFNADGTWSMTGDSSLSGSGTADDPYKISDGLMGDVAWNKVDALDANTMVAGSSWTISGPTTVDTMDSIPECSKSEFMTVADNDANDVDKTDGRFWVRLPAALESGKYEAYCVTEKTAPTGYSLLKNSLHVFVAADGAVVVKDKAGTALQSTKPAVSDTVTEDGETVLRPDHVEFKDLKTVKWQKVDSSDTTKLLFGSVWQWSDSSGLNDPVTVADNSDNDLDPAVGKFAVNLPGDGSWVLSEIRAPFGHEKATQTWSLGDNVNNWFDGSVKITNYGTSNYCTTEHPCWIGGVGGSSGGSFGSFKIVKVDADTGEKLKGSGFTFKPSYDGGGTTWTVIDGHGDWNESGVMPECNAAGIASGNLDGEITPCDWPDLTGEWAETTAPDGYDPTNFKITFDKSGDCGTYKSDSDDVTVTNTCSDGQVVSDVTITVKDHKSTSERGYIEWSKVDSKDNTKLLAGSEWAVSKSPAYNSDYDIIPGCSDNGYSSPYTADKPFVDNGADDLDKTAGKLKLKVDPCADYQITETKAPVGHTKWTTDGNYTRFTVQMDSVGKATYGVGTSDTVKSSVVPNSIATYSIDLQKVAESDTSLHLGGSEWELRKKDGTVIEKIVDDGGNDSRNVEACTSYTSSYDDDGDFSGAFTADDCKQDKATEWTETYHEDVKYSAKPSQLWLRGYTGGNYTGDYVSEASPIPAGGTSDAAAIKLCADTSTTWYLSEADANDYNSIHVEFTEDQCKNDTAVEYTQSVEKTRKVMKKPSDFDVAPTGFINFPVDSTMVGDLDLVETKAPAGYGLYVGNDNGKIHIKLSYDNSTEHWSWAGDQGLDDSGPMIVPDPSDTGGFLDHFPLTGDAGSWVFMLAGGLLLVAGAVTVIVIRKRLASTVGRKDSASSAE